ncbi:hypothetical protein B0T17DRAFT_525418 [Bombardia bombarda]|uniref:F-box domain-containing protein n=1 Tax=Bombardia bombarda TaxID=252184 RepID=A0AA39X9W1_9PEZI|nr:hypothetical protein B0T17DRAFT_525418 [Bombardia bombarda]
MADVSLATLTPSPASLSTVPPEILCLVIANLDPISLINLAQTSTQLRILISPSRQHFVDRLLALELLPQHGGIVPIFHARENKLTPSWSDPSWASSKYACAGCLKLLPHMLFDNRSILNLGLRKPPPGSLEATKLTDWEPNYGPGAHWRRHRSERLAQKQAEKVLRQKYNSAVNGLNRPAPPPGQGQWPTPPTAAQIAEDDALALSVEMTLCGNARHKRFCNECRFQRGDFAWQTKQLAAMGVPVANYPEVPIVKSRMVHLPGNLDRFLPGLCGPLLPADITKERHWAVMRSNQDEATTSQMLLWTVRCPGCQKWHEWAAFRRFSEKPERMDMVYSHMGSWPGDDSYGDWGSDEEDEPSDNFVSKSVWNPEMLAKGWAKSQVEFAKSFKCNRCLAAAQGRGQLAQQLGAAAAQLVEEELMGLHAKLRFGWEMLDKDFFAPGGKLNRTKYEAVRQEVWGGIKWRWVYDQLLFDFNNTIRPLEMDGEKDEDADIDSNKVLLDLGRRLRRFKAFIEDEADEDDREEIMQKWFKLWVEDYDIMERTLQPMRDLLDKVKKEPGWLADYVLEKDPYRIM